MNVNTGRKRRTLTGNYQLLSEMPELLSCRRNPIFVQFISHKVGRLLVPWDWPRLFISNLFPACAALTLQPSRLRFCFHCMAAAGRLIPNRTAILSYRFVLMNWAVLAGSFSIRARDHGSLEPGYVEAEIRMTATATRAATPAVSELSAFRAEIICDYQAFLDLAPAWSAAVRTAGIDHPFLEQDWRRTRRECFGAGSTLHIVVVRGNR